MNNPVPAKWVQINRNTFTLYHGRVTWIEAVTFCRAQGTRLAVIKNQNIINILVNSMTKSRPGKKQKQKHGYLMKIPIESFKKKLSIVLTYTERLTFVFFQINV